ncbi:unnamed protein product [Staurois parvus]|uniref:Uncharacterized protein n=1 Tax=Staurois parvus TaxID=386267 RepID=A0ABN9F6N6_9NEOB|nr:unnamed protein product [Staurois parvus]
MRPLQRPRPSPSADASIRLPVSGSVRTYGGRNGGKFLHFFKLSFS